MNRVAKSIVLYFVVVLAGLATSLFAIGLAWDEFGSKATKVILSAGENGSLGRLSQDLDYQLMLVEALERDNTEFLYNAHCYKINSIIESINPSLAEDFAQMNRLVELSSKASKKLEELKRSGKCE
ncbi:hypothetical protein [Marinimicrobium sp. ABcell2]|uniref:hypothetical protein n=1 Tax=Marinimicrobium sp. ABcell2 TaxID=3069751 RepID=UPI0027B1CF4F|nr:hypothetical protein [Marinimicrobium sp. ABcell2]MDQ2076751.1 hypothetical protein [Marinimicrobium sp. ABcell2]